MDIYYGLDTIRRNKPSLMRHKIITSVIALLENENFQDISVSDLCSKLKISRTTYYEYFDSKQELFVQVFNYFWEELVRRTGNLPYDEAMRFAMGYIDERKVLFKNLMYRKTSSTELAVLTKFLAHTVARELEMQEKCGREKRFDFELVSVFYAGGFVNLVMYWLANDFRITREQVTEVVLGVYGGDVPLFVSDYGR